MIDLSNYSTSKVVRSLKLRIERDPLQWFRPSSTEQQNALRSRSKGTLIVGGNRSGKTCVGAVRAVARAIEREVCGYSPKRARRIWCISQELPDMSRDTDKPHTQLEEIRRWLPSASLRGQSWGRSWSPGAHTLTLDNGSKFEFKSYDQDALAFESAAVDHIWFDEEPTRRSIFTSCRLRLVDRRGTWDMTLTPILSLEGKGAVAEHLWDDRVGAEERGEYTCYQLLTSRNIHLPQDEVKSLESLPEEERQVRLYGAFARLGGRVVNEFDPTRHIIADFIPPVYEPHTLTIDPGWKTAAHYFDAVDRRGAVRLYDELYVHEMPIPERMAHLHRMWRLHGEPDIDVIMDRAAFSKTRQGGSEREMPSDADEYRAAADKLGATWFIPRPCIKADPQAYRVNRYFASDMLFVCRSLKWWLWEQERWTRQREREGGLATERAIPEMPIQRYDHAMDCTRYRINELPEPTPDAPPRNLIEDQSWLPEALRDRPVQSRDALDYGDAYQNIEVPW